jgi:hypothetical protein
MLSDWLWVARERSLGDALLFYPASRPFMTRCAPDWRGEQPRKKHLRLFLPIGSTACNEICNLLLRLQRRAASRVSGLREIGTFQCARKPDWRSPCFETRRSAHAIEQAASLPARSDVPQHEVGNFSQMISI